MFTSLADALFVVFSCVALDIKPVCIRDLMYIRQFAACLKRREDQYETYISITVECLFPFI